MMDSVETIKKFKQGVVVSNKMQKTITVRIDRREKHPLYGKIITKSTKVHVHDPENIANEGDVVVIKLSRPFAKTKSWELVEVVAKTSNVG